MLLPMHEKRTALTFQKFAIWCICCLFLKAPITPSLCLVDGETQVLATQDNKCPCSKPELCKQIKSNHEREVFSFSLEQPGKYAGYDWSQLTTVAWNEDPELMCLAHSHGARVVLNAGLGADATEFWSNASARTKWVEMMLDRAEAKHMDGVNFDYEEPQRLGSPDAQHYAALVRECAEAFHSRLPGSQISVDVPWSPYDVDGRNFDWLSFAESADLLFVMAYDMQSQIWGRCLASANSPPELVSKGIKQFLDLGIPADKLVLGLPWYGYMYKCVNPDGSTDGVSDDVELCAVASVPFRGCSCSDAAGRQFRYADVQALFKSHATTQLRWDKTQQAPYFNLRGGITAYDIPDGIYQVWFDSPKSLLAKYELAASLRLRGVGFWNLDHLAYVSTDPAVQNDTQAMWDAVRSFTRS